MTPDIAALAGTAGTALVSLLTTEAWQRLRDGLVDLWRKVRPDRAQAIEAELGATRDDLLKARDDGDKGTEEELRLEWQGRVRRLLDAHPEAYSEPPLGDLRVGV